MSYGERLQAAIDRRGVQLRREVTRAEVAKVAECTVQNVGMIITNAKGKDQKFGVESHFNVCWFLRVNPTWLLNGTGSMEPSVDAPEKLTHTAIDLGSLFDLIPETDLIKRSLAYNKASSAIMQVLRGDSASIP